MPIPYEEAVRRAEARARAGGGIAGGSFQPPEDDALSLAQRAGDVVMAPLRGLEGAAQDLYGLADTLALDVLPDYEERLFGESRTGLGGLLEGIVNFGAGFYAAGFVPMGWTGKLGRLAPAVRGAVRGALADFSVFDGHEERLSNLIQSVPALRNPINEFLAADESDGQIEGRFKNALEGLGIGAATDLALLAFKGLRAGRKVRLAGGAPEAVEEAIDKVAPPEEVQKAMSLLDRQDPGPSPLPGQVGEPSLPAAIGASAEHAPDSANLPNTVSPPTPEAGQLQVMKTFGLEESHARGILEEVHRRQAPFSHATLLERDPLDPRVNPRRLTEQELLVQGMLKSDLNLSGYQGPEGALNLIRSFEQVLSPLRELGDAERRTFKQIEQDNLKSLGDMVGEGNPQRLIASLQKDAKELSEINTRALAYKTALQAHADHAYRVATEAFRGTDERKILEAIVAFETHADLEKGVRSLLGEQGRGLGANRIRTPMVADLFDRSAVEAALHERGGRQRALDLIAKFRTLYNSEVDPVARTAKVTDMAKGLTGRRALGILNEYWMNSLVSRPTTYAVTAMSNGLMTVLRPIERILGGALSGRSDAVSQGIREIRHLTISAEESWKATMAAIRGEGQVLDPKSLISDIHDPSRKAITAANVGLNPDTAAGQAVEYLGKVVRFPNGVLSGTDQFTQQLNFRAVARAQLESELLRNPSIPKEKIAELVQADMDKLIYRGQAYGTAQLYHRGVEEAVQSGLRAKDAVDAHAKEYVRKALASPENARLSAVADVAGRRAREAAFTAPLEPGSISYRYQEMVMNHWYMRLVTPFVRSPVNILKAANDRSVGAVWGVAQMLAARKFPSVAAGLEHSRNAFVRDMLSGDPIRAADAKGRLALGMSAATLVLTKAAESDEDGFPTITGRGPSDREQRRLLEEAGWQPYSIRIGNTYVSYARLDPFASVIGTAADIVNYVKYAAAEDQNAVEDTSIGLAVALASNLTNKTYLSGLAGALDMLGNPQKNFPVWARTLAGSFVPGAAASAVSVQDPLVRDLRTILDGVRSRWPGASDDLPPLRNVLGEPVRRAQSLGSGISSVTNAFVPVLYREVSDDLVNKELARLQHGFTPPKRTRGGLDLTTVRKDGTGQDAYDRWLELHGEVKLGGKTLRQAMRRLITSREYERIPPESTDELASPRIQMIQNLIDDYRQRALNQLYKEYPEVAQAERARVGRKAELARGKESRPELLRLVR